MLSWKPSNWQCYQSCTKTKTLIWNNFQERNQTELKSGALRCAQCLVQGQTLADTGDRWHFCQCRGVILTSTNVCWHGAPTWRWGQTAGGANGGQRWRCCNPMSGIQTCIATKQKQFYQQTLRVLWRKISTPESWQQWHFKVTVVLVKSNYAPFSITEFVHCKCS